jgi:hypothetical protein
MEHWDKWRLNSLWDKKLCPGIVEDARHLTKRAVRCSTFSALASFVDPRGLVRTSATCLSARICSTAIVYVYLHIVRIRNDELCIAIQRVDELFRCWGLPLD